MLLSMRRRGIEFEELINTLSKFLQLLDIPLAIATLYLSTRVIFYMRKY